MASELPPELIAQILVLVLECPRLLDRSGRSNVTRLQLVCKTWHETVLSTPSIRRGLAVVVPDDFGTLSNATKLVGDWFARAGNEDLRLAVDVSPLSKPGSAIAKRVPGVLQRLIQRRKWTELHFHSFPSSFIPKFAAILEDSTQRSNWASLRCLSISGNSCSTVPPLTLGPLNFDTLSNLRSLYLKYISLTDWVSKFPVSPKLEVLHLDNIVETIPNFDTPILLNRLPNLKKLTISGLTLQRQPGAPNYPGNSCTHPRIETLILNEPSSVVMTRYLTLPSLRVLRLTQTRSFYGTIACGLLHELLQRSQPDLTILSLEDWWDSHVYSILMLMGSMTIRWIYLPSLFGFSRLEYSPNSFRGLRGLLVKEYDEAFLRKVVSFFREARQAESLEKDRSKEPVLLYMRCGLPGTLLKEMEDAGIRPLLEHDIAKAVGPLSCQISGHCP